MTATCWFLGRVATVAGNYTITIVGNTRNKWNAEADWLQAFRRLGHRVLVLDERAATLDRLVEAGLKSDFVFFVLSKYTVQPEWVEELKDFCPTVAWHADLFHGLKRDGEWHTSAKFNCDIVFTADGGNDKQWEKMGVNHRWLLPGVRDNWVLANGLRRRNLVCDVAFVGNNGSTYHPEWPYRQEMFSALQGICRKRRWKFLNPGGLQRALPRNLTMNNFYASATVTVGDSLCFDRQKSLYWSDRVYEATGRKGALIMPRIDALDDQFDGALPFYEWGDWGSLEFQIERFLSDDKARSRVVAETFEVTKAGHTYRSRAEKLLGVLQAEGLL